MKILVSDDELLLRLSLKYLLIEIGIKPENIDEASNGVQMLEMLKVENYDVAFVDIKMPLLNGLDAIQSALQTSIHTDFYVLSGYDEFTYVQTAIRLGVKDYLLKPLKKSDLSQIISNAYANKQNKQNARLNQLRLYASGLLENQLFLDSLDNECQAIFIVNDKAVSFNEIGTIDQKVEDIFEGLICHSRHYKSGLFVFYLEDICVAGKPNRLYERIKTGFLDCSIINVGQIDLLSWGKKLERVERIVQSRPAFGYSLYYAKNHKVMDLPDEINNLCNYCLELLKHYNNNDMVQFNICIDEWYHIFHKVNKNDPYVRNVISFLKKCFNIDIDDINLIPKELSKISITNLKYKDKSKTLIDEIKAYIQENYSGEISVSLLATYFSLSPNYLTTLFKKNTQSTIIIYLTKIRIEHSKKLLIDSNLSVNEIAERVGYHSVSYFIRKFSEYVGTTPAEYRELLK